MVRQGEGKKKLHEIPETLLSVWGKSSFTQEPASSLRHLYWIIDKFTAVMWG